jgi:hypothetical protein
MAGRRVRWYSWTALLLVSVGLAMTIRMRGGLYLPPLAIVTVVLYTLGYFVRLAVMTRVGKTDDPDTVKGYFVEEKIVAIPVAVLVMAVLSALDFGPQGGQLGFGFVHIWVSNQMPWVAAVAVLLVLISVLAILILMDRRENTYCVPLERARRGDHGIHPGADVHGSGADPRGIGGRRTAGHRHFCPVLRPQAATRPIGACSIPLIVEARLEWPCMGHDFFWT